MQAAVSCHRMCQRYLQVRVISVNAVPLPACRNKARSQSLLPSSASRISAPPVAAKENDAS